MEKTVAPNKPEITISDYLVELEIGMSILNDLLKEFNSKNIFTITSLEQLALLVIFREEYLEKVSNMIEIPLGKELNLDMDTVWDLCDEAEEYLHQIKMFHMHDGVITITLNKLAEVFEYSHN